MLTDFLSKISYIIPGLCYSVEFEFWGSISDLLLNIEPGSPPKEDWNPLFVPE